MAAYISTPSTSHSSSDIISMQIITTKLNGSNYLLWAQVMKVALDGRKKLKYIESNPPSKDSKDYEDWVSDNYLVMTWFWNSMDRTISSIVMLLPTANAIWESVRESFSNGRMFYGFMRSIKICFFFSMGINPLASITANSRV